MSLNFNILTLFPDMFPGSLGQSLSGKALENGAWSYEAVNMREYGHGVHNAVDDTPYGGGAGMVMRPDIIEEALLSVPNAGRKIYLSPRGRVLNQELAQELAQESNITLLCGRYEGVDQRALYAHAFEEISIGDYILSGGEPAALILMDSCIRLLDGVMGNKDTAPDESFGAENDGLLEYPHYTRPPVWSAADGNDYAVPEVLQSGHHGKIAAWRKEQSLKITQERRPDLIRVAEKKSD